MKGTLVLDDGTEFQGILKTPGLGASGEVVFNTGMTGYEEILTDPSYAGQIIVFTSPHIGNTGINYEDHEGARPLCAGVIIHELTESPCHHQSKNALLEFLIRHRVPLLTGVDTRALTRRLRARGVAQGRILGSAHPRFRVLTLDFGIKSGLIRELEARGCELEILPADTPTPEVLERIAHRDGVFLSNGPGDPSRAVVATETVRTLAGALPIFGVCMGHQVLAQALGGRTYKLKFGHRGCNQPVMNHVRDRVEISSHNHGYSVEATSLPPQVRVTHVHLNDQSVEGLRWQPPSGLAPAFSVQYHPEASPGPHDSMDCFQEFIEDMLAWSRKKRNNQKPRTTEPRTQTALEAAP